MFGTRKKKNTQQNTNQQVSTSAILGNSKKSKNNENVSNTNRIGQGTKIEGELISEGTIRIDGEIEGYVESKSRVIVGETARIKGDVVCESLDISGLIIGKIQVKNTVTVMASARIDGDIITDQLIMESGAQFNGQMKTKVTSTVQNSLLSNKQKPEGDQLSKKAI